MISTLTTGLGGRDVAGTVIGLAALPVGFMAGVGVWVDAAAAMPAAVAGCLALGVAVSWPRARPWVAVPALVAAACSLAATAYVVSSGSSVDQVGGLVGFAEMAGLLLLLALVVRWAPTRMAYVAGCVVAAAQALWIVRFLPPEAQTPLGVIGGCVLWSLGSLGAVIVGGYPRLAALRLDRSVATARQAQRLELAHDLHDFVAHDVSGMVAQAQAARFVHIDDASELRAVLERIETIGLQALSAMDDLVETLGEAEESKARRLSLATLSDLPDLVTRFRTERPASHVTLTQDKRSETLVEAMPGVEMTAYRVVVEALSNIRRHAPAARHVAIDIRADDDDVLHVRVRNDLGGRARITLPGRTRGGGGLLHLRERVCALGGQMAAGPDEHGGWTVAVTVPLRRMGTRRD